MRPGNFIHLLVDPETKEKLELSASGLHTASGKTYPLSPAGKPDLVGKRAGDTFTAKRDLLDRIKARCKALLGPAYVTCVHIIAPVMPRIHWASLQTYWSYLSKKKAAGKNSVIQIGSGNDRISGDIINIDIFDYPGVDLVADCTRLPFADNSMDGVISLAVLEHVHNPDDFLKEALRVLKPGGFIITGVPFMQGYHASPSDHTRWTHEGLASWHERNGFSTEQVIPNSGPTSALIWVFQEWLAILLSFGLTPLYYLWWFVFTLALCPVKLLDLLLIHYPQSYRINSFNIYLGKKP
jgi:SAM-dependent methyltransferase